MHFYKKRKTMQKKKMQKKMSRPYELKVGFLENC